MVDEDDEKELTPEESFNRGTNLLNTGQFHNAIAYLDKAIAVNEDYATAYLSRGMAYNKLGEREVLMGNHLGAIPFLIQGINDLRKIVPAPPHSTDAVDTDIVPSHLPVSAHFVLGNCYLELGKVEEAIEDYASAKNMFITAIAHYKAGIRLDPSNSHNYFNCAFVYGRLAERAYRSEAYEEALAALEQSDDMHKKMPKPPQTDPFYTEGWFNLALNFLIRGDTLWAMDQEQHMEEAEKNIESAGAILTLQVIPRAPRHVRALFSSGQVHTTYGEIREHQNRADDARNDFLNAESNYTHAIAAAPNFARAYALRGIVRQQHLDKQEEALDDFRRAVKLEPRNRVYRRTLIDRLVELATEEAYDEALLHYAELHDQSLGEDQAAIIREIAAVVGKMDMEERQRERRQEDLKKLAEESAEKHDAYAKKNLPKRPDEDTLRMVLYDEIRDVLDKHKVCAGDHTKCESVDASRAKLMFITTSAGIEAAGQVRPEIPPGLTIILAAVAAILLSRVEDRVLEPFQKREQEKSKNVVNAFGVLQGEGAAVDELADTLVEIITDEYGYIVEALHLNSLGVVDLAKCIVERMFDALSDPDVAQVVRDGEMDLQDVMLEGMRTGTQTRPVAVFINLPAYCQ